MKNIIGRVVFCGILLFVFLGCSEEKKASFSLSIDPEEVARGQLVELSLSTAIVVGKGDVSAVITPDDGLEPMNLRRETDKNILVDIDVASDAVLGTHLLTLETSTGKFEGEVKVVSGPSSNKTFICDIDSIRRGNKRTVHVTGKDTHFDTDSTYIEIVKTDKNIILDNLKVLNSLNAQFDMAVDEEALLGLRNLRLVTGNETALGTIFVTGDDNRLTISPAEVRRGEHVEFTVEGRDTNFTAETSVSFGPDSGIAVSDVSVESGTRITFIGEIDLSTQGNRTKNNYRSTT